MATKPKTVKATRSYTTVKGERVTKYSDGSEKRVPASGGSTSGKKQTFGVNASGAPLQGIPPKLETDQGQTLKDYSIAWGGGSFGGASTGVTSDSTAAKTTEDNLRTDISDQLKRLQRDQERQIQKERDALELRRKKEIDSIDTDYDTEKDATAFTQSRETGQTSMDLARMGGYLGNTASQSGVLQNLANSQRKEMTILEDRRQAALREANNAYEDRDFELAREKLQVARDTEQEIYDRQQEFDRINRDEEQKVQEDNKKAATQASIFSAIDGGATDIQSIFTALGGKITVEEINSVLNAIKPKAPEGEFSFSSSNTAGLLGAGMSAERIAAFNEAINENGYTEELRASLSSRERAAADKIFREIEKTTGSTDPTKAMSILDIQRIEDTYGVLFPLGVSTAEVTQFLQDNVGKSASDMQDAIDLIFGNQEEAQGTAGSGVKIDMTEEWFRGNLDQGQLKKLADLVGASSWWRYKSYDIDDMFNTPEFFTLLGNKIQQLRDEGISDADIIIALTS